MLNPIIAQVTSRTSKFYDTLGKFDGNIVVKKSSKAYKPCTEISETEFAIMSILAKMTEGTGRNSREIYASLEKLARIRQYKNKQSNSVYREFLDYAKLGTDTNIISAINLLVTFGVNISYTGTGTDLRIEKKSGLISCQLTEKIIRKSETTGLFYLSSVRKFRTDTETNTVLSLLQSSKDYTEFVQGISEKLHSDSEFALAISEEIARKQEIARKWKELTSGEISEGIDSEEIDTEEIAL